MPVIPYSALFNLVNIGFLILCDPTKNKEAPGAMALKKSHPVSLK